MRKRKNTQIIFGAEYEPTNYNSIADMKQHRP